VQASAVAWADLTDVYGRMFSRDRFVVDVAHGLAALGTA
jgi:hypothetical protein